ncbi:uncharacterized protein Dana_GF26573 [Drosophila ananassae]|uniref:Uncharacterized protein n=1 Tax=Drosophila ananassae TaxID=7217 RepID=A0A0P9AGX2_DROAN|nr:uncharacterized protein Dana_GF26573 [Drosophila ananassae]
MSPNQLIKIVCTLHFGLIKAGQQTGPWRGILGDLALVPAR